MAAFLVKNSSPLRHSRWCTSWVH